MKRWLGWTALLCLGAGCGSTARQHRASVMAAAPGGELIIVRAPIEPVDMPCGKRFDSIIERWRTLVRAQADAPFGSQSDLGGQLKIMHADVRTRFDEFLAAKIDHSGKPPPDFRDSPACQRAVAINSTLLHLQTVDAAHAKKWQAFGEALEARHVDPKLPEPEQPEPIDYTPSIAELMTHGALDAAHYLQGHQHALRSEWPLARAAFEQIAPDSPHAAEAAFRLGWIDAKAGRHTPAIARFERVIALKSARFGLFARYFKARSQFVVGEIKPAIQELLALARDDNRLDAGQVAAFLLASDWDGPPPDADRGKPRAERLLSDAGHDRVRRRLVEELVAQSQSDAAIAVADWALRIAPLSPEAPGLLRARRRAVQHLSGDGPKPAQPDPTAILGTDWMTANASNDAAMRAATALLSETEEKRSRSLARGPQPDPEVPEFDTPEAGFEVATNLFAKEHYSAAGATFMTLVQEHPRADWVPKALFNAAVAFERVGRIESASRCYQQLVEAWPKSDLAQPALQRWAFDALRRFQFERARPLLMRFAHQYPDDRTAGDALLNVAQIDIALERSPIEALTGFLARKPSGREAVAARLELARAQHAAGQFDAEITTLDALLKTPNLPSGDTMYALQAKADALVANGKPKAARPLWTRLMKGFPEAERQSLGEEGIRGRARFELLEPVFERLQKTAARKRFKPADAKALLRLYDVLIRRRSPQWRAAGLFRQAQVHLIWAGFAQPKDAAALRNRGIELLRQLLPRTRLFAREGVRYRPALSGVWAAKARIELCRLAACPPDVRERLAPIPATRTMALQTTVRADRSSAQAQAQSALDEALRALKKNDVKAAQSTLEGASARLIDFAEADLNLALLAERTGESPTALYRRARRTMRLLAEIETARVLAAMRAGRPTKTANPHAQVRLAVLADPPSTTVLSQATDALNADSNSRLARLNWARAALRQGLWRKALLALTQLEGPEAWTLRARIEIDQKRPELGALLLDRAIATAAAPAEAYALRARLHHLAGEYERAEALNRAALDRWPGLTAAQVNLALALRRQGQRKAAIDLLLEVDSHWAQVNLGLIHLQSGRKKQAKQVFDGLTLSPRDTQLQRWTAEVHPTSP